MNVGHKFYYRARCQVAYVD